MPESLITRFILLVCANLFRFSSKDIVKKLKQFISPTGISRKYGAMPKLIKEVSLMQLIWNSPGILHRLQQVGVVLCWIGWLVNQASWTTGTDLGWKKHVTGLEVTICIFPLILVNYIFFLDFPQNAIFLSIQGLNQFLYSFFSCQSV